MAEVIVCEDKISALPDDLLVKILLLIPTKEAVASMILSKRWKSIWTLMHILNFKEDNNDDDQIVSVWWFLDKAMKLHKAPVLKTLCIELGEQCPVDADVAKWIAKAVDCKLVNLRFSLLWSANPISLPTSLYTCETLTVLSLSHKILVDFPLKASLSSLKLLELWYVMYKDDDSLSRFLSNCHVLKFLVVKREDDDNVKKFSIKVPSLLFLSYDNYMLLPDENDVGNRGWCSVIDTPRLKSLKVSNSWKGYCSIENMSCLEDVYIDIECFVDDTFLRSFSSIKTLELFFTTQMITCCNVGISFPHLVKLTIHPRESDWSQPFMSLLHNSPKLKILIINHEFAISDDVFFSWNQPSFVPRCFSLLEIFKFKSYDGSVGEKELLTYILANSKCLKKIIVSMESILELEEKQTIMEELKLIPRVSMTSQLLFKTYT